jgi:hypothetical protein
MENPWRKLLDLIVHNDHGEFVISLLVCGRIFFGKGRLKMKVSLHGAPVPSIHSINLGRLTLSPKPLGQLQSFLNQMIPHDPTFWACPRQKLTFLLQSTISSMRLVPGLISLITTLALGSRVLNGRAAGSCSVSVLAPRSAGLLLAFACDLWRFDVAWTSKETKYVYRLCSYVERERGL